MQWGTRQSQFIIRQTNHKRVMPASWRPCLIPHCVAVFHCGMPSDCSDGGCWNMRYFFGNHKAHLPMICLLVINYFEILPRVQEQYWHALCKILKSCYNWNGCYQKFVFKMSFAGISGCATGLQILSLLDQVFVRVWNRVPVSVWRPSLQI